MGAVCAWSRVGPARRETAGARRLEPRALPCALPAAVRAPRRRGTGASAAPDPGLKRGKEEIKRRKIEKRKRRKERKKRNGDVRWREGKQGQKKKQTGSWIEEERKWCKQWEDGREHCKGGSGERNGKRPRGHRSQEDEKRVKEKGA